ncbi:MAG: hypothetical protein HWN80_19090 [Candidatus Lokiarchaeota archaeon]|nr:hypothetical protein [Candidatus Lokiarchaeota archaeon]
MPFTPFHLGPALVIGIIFIYYIDFPTLLVASVILDIEPFLVLLLDLNYPLHGFFHSFLGGTIIILPLSIIMFKIRPYLNPIMDYIKIKQKSSFPNILTASIIGIYLHLLLDAPLYSDIQPFFPLNFNPFLNISDLWSNITYLFCGYCFLVAIILYFVYIAIQSKKEKNNNNKS